MPTRWVCECCGAEFNEPDYVRWYEHHGEFVEPWGSYRCPCCGSDEICESYDIYDEEDDEWVA